LAGQARPLTSSGNSSAAKYLTLFNGGLPSGLEQIGQVHHA
jgi:hypothetical protein